MVDQELVNYKMFVDDLSRYFTSCNKTPVDRATIRLTDFQKLIKKHIPEHELNLIKGVDFVQMP